MGGPRFPLILVAAGLALSACANEKKSLCERYVDRLRACDIVSPGRVNCMGLAYDPDAQTRCEAECLLPAACEDLWMVTCTGSATGDLAACLDACMSEHGFVCLDGSGTIPLAWRCDTVADCDDGSDENGCPTFECPDGTATILETEVCDGFLDCDDGADEDGCPAFPTFLCRDGSFEIPTTWVCDFEADCADGSDEQGCAEYLCD